MSSWARTSELFERAVELPPEEQQAFLERACEPELRADVERLLALDRGADPRLDRDAPPWTPAPGQRIGAYEIVRAIGSGGMGTVFEAVQERPRRTVALKMLRAGLASPARVQRFLFEAETLGRLRHPGIAQIHAAGTHVEAGGHHPWFAMELVTGARDVLTYAREERLTLEQGLALCEQVCAAVHHGHQKGVVHRDLKAENVLVDAEGRPKVIDFGVARCTDLLADARATQAGEIVGTLGSMSPEQLAGDAADVDARTDVYALGVILWELATGVPPHDLEGLSLAQAIQRVRESPPRGGERLPRELSWVLKTALERDPARRYASASELALDLARFREHEPVAAGPPGVAYRLQKLARRYRLPLAALAAVVLALGIGLARAAGAARAEARARADAVREASRARAVGDTLEWILTSLGPDRAGRAVTVEEVLRAAEGLVAEVSAAEPAAGATLQKLIGASYTALHREQDAERHLAAARAYAAAELEPDDRLSIEIECGWAAWLLRFDRDREAADHARALLARAEPVLGPDDPQTDAIRRVLASALYVLDEIDEAERLALASLEVLRAEGGGKRSVPVLLQLAAIALRRGAATDLALARERALEALALCEPGDPRSEFDVVEARQILELVAAKGGEPPAVTTAEAAAESARPDLFESACVALATLVQGAAEASEAGDHEAARDGFERALVESDRLFGPDALISLQTRNNLAFELVETGRLEDARKWSEEAVAIARRTLSPDHRTALRVEATAALVLVRDGDPAAGAEGLREVLRRVDAIQPTDQELALDLLVSIGEAHAALGDAPGLDQAAEEHARRTAGSPEPSWRAERFAELARGLAERAATASAH